jgi:tocopherol O-methyltransferase
MNDMTVLVPGHDYRTAAPETLREDIVRYYNECYWDYRTSWLNGDNLAIHYGYWDEATRSHGQALLNMNRLLANTAAIAPGCRVLDAGCGIGGSAIWLAENRGARVTGITLSDLQVSQARRNAANRGVSQLVDFEAADFCATPFEDESFDIVWGIESICHALDKGGFVREARRLLRKGGRLVCSDGYALRREFDEREWKIVRTCLDGWQIPNLATPDEFAGYIEQAGFRDMCFQDVTPNIMPSSKRLYNTARLTYPMQKIMGWLKLRTPAQTGNFYTALNQYRIFADGLGCYGVFCAVK